MNPSGRTALRGGAPYDPDQVAHRPDHRGVRDRDRRAVGGDAVGGGDASLSASAWPPLVHAVPYTGLSALGDLPVVVSLRRLRAAHLRQGGRARRRQRLRRLRRREDRKSVVEGKSVSVRVAIGGPRIIKKNNKNETRITSTVIKSCIKVY